jgi:hypothetical protein
VKETEVPGVKPPTCHKSLTNFITLWCIEYTFDISGIRQDIKADEKDEEFIVDKDGNLSKTSPATTPISSLRDTDVAVEYNVGPSYKQLEVKTNRTSYKMTSGFVMKYSLHHNICF